MTKDAYNNIYDRKGLGFYTEYISLPLQVNDLSKHLVPGKNHLNHVHETKDHGICYHYPK